MLKVWRWLQVRFGLVPTGSNVVGRRVIQPGQCVWECELKTGEVRKAEVVVCPWIDKQGNEMILREAIVKKGCIYEVALNGGNAVKKFESRIVEHYKK